MKIKKLRLRNIVTIVSLLVLVIIYFLLQPRMSGIFPFIRKQRLDAFLNTITKTKSIDPQEFWQLREFYYPGTVTLDRNGIFDKKAPVVNPEVKPLLFFQFKSKYISSNEYLINSSDLNWIVPFNENYHIDLSGSFAYKESDKNFELIFIKPISELTKANGFIYDKDQDKKLVTGKYWLVITMIQK